MWASLLAAGLPAAAGVAPEDGPPADLERLVAEARAVQQSDLRHWGRLAFRREVVRERLDADDRVVDREVLVFFITPGRGGEFDEGLRTIDGRLPTRSEVQAHRRARRFNKRYKTALTGDASDYEEGDFSLGHFMTRSDYTYGGLEMVDGIRCHRLDFAAQPESGGGVASRISAATEGSMWLDVRTLHAVRAESRLTRPVTAMLGLVRIERVDIEMSTLSFGEHRLPAEIVVTSRVAMAGRALRKRNRFLYSDHRGADEAASSDTADR